MPKPPTVSIEGFASDFAAGTFIPSHRHQTHQFVHAVSGVMRVQVDNGIWVLPPGRGLWVPAQTPHEIRCACVVKMRTAYLDGDNPSFPPELQITNVSDLMREILVRLSEGATDTETPLLTAMLISEIAASDIQPLRLPIPKDLRLARLTNHLITEPADSASLVTWAHRLAMSERSLIRMIRRETGLSFRELRRQARVINSIERLALGHSVTTVALDVGFESPSAFIQSFRRVTGTTPGRYLHRQ